MGRKAKPARRAAAPATTRATGRHPRYGPVGPPASAALRLAAPPGHRDDALLVTAALLLVVAAGGAAVLGVVAARVWRTA